MKKKYLTAKQAILYYDYVLTLGDEVRYYWLKKKKRNAGTVLFFLNRYINPLCTAPIEFLPFSFWTPEVSNTPAVVIFLVDLPECKIITEVCCILCLGLYSTNDLI